MGRIKHVILLVCFLTSPLFAQADPNIIRIAAVSRKNFGQTKADDPPRLKFIADRIAEQAVHGICAVDELQDKDGSAFVVLQQAAVAHPAVGIHVRLRRAGLANGDELPVHVVEFAQFVFQHREEPGLDAVPEYAQSCPCVHGSASLLTGYV